VEQTKMQHPTATGAVRALGYSATRLKQLQRERGAMARVAREILPQVTAITKTGRFGKPITIDVVESAFQSILESARVAQRKTNGNGKPSLDRVEARLGTFTRVASPTLPFEGDTIEQALNDMLSAMQRVETFVQQAKLAQAWLMKMRRELPEVQS